MSTDLCGAIDALAEFNRARLDEDEAAAKAAGSGTWLLRSHPSESVVIHELGGGSVVYDEGSPSEGEAAHITRQDPARILRDVQAKRDLITAILAEPHDYNPCDSYYSCSQAEEIDPTPGEGGPGSGCSDEDRAGDPCDCGRDARVERLLRLLASTWTAHPAYPLPASALGLAQDSR